MDRMTERQYDDVYNEGGDGYNPVRAAREDHEAEESAAYARTPVARLQALERKARGMYANKIIYTDAEINAVEADASALRKEIARIARAQIEQNGWTREATIARRAEWNARARAGLIVPAQIASIQTAQGWYIADLKRAVALHNL